MPLENFSEQLSQRAEIDLNDLQPIRERVSYIDRLARGETPGAPAPLPPDQGSALAPPNVLTERAPSGVMPDAAPPAYAPPPAPPGPAAPAADIPPVLPQDSPRVQDRINKLYAQRRGAEETVARLERIVAEQNARFDAFMTGVSRPAPSQPNVYPTVPGGMMPPFGSDQNAPPPAGDSVSRAELARILAAERNQFLALNALNRAQDSARVEAQRDFPDVFAQPELRAAFEQIVGSDPVLAGDPYGPYKAAALARGLIGAHGVATAPPAGEARRQAISVPGVSVPESQASQQSRESRYYAQLARARVTQDPTDFVKARMIQLGQL